MSVIRWRSVSLVDEPGLTQLHHLHVARKAWRYQKSLIEEKHSMERALNDKQWSKEHYPETQRLRSTNPLKTKCELMYHGRVSRFYSISGTRHVTLNSNPVINHECRKDLLVIMTNEAHMWSFVSQIFRNSHNLSQLLISSTPRHNL